MASNRSNNNYCWRVRILSLPASITIDELARIFNLPIERITIPKYQQTATYLAWINGFTDEKNAKDFAQQWSDSTIRCKALPPKNSSANIRHPSSKLIQSNFQSDYDKITSNELNNTSTNIMASENLADEQPPFASKSHIEKCANIDDNENFEKIN